MSSLKMKILVVLFILFVVNIMNAKVLNTSLEATAKVLKQRNATTDNNFIVVAQDGSGNYLSIQDAINNCAAFSYKKTTIFIKNGTYKEKIRINEWNTNIILLGESKEETIITYDDNFNKIGLGKNSTFYTYTLLVEANDIVLKNLTIENSSGDIGQAVALSIFSDRVMVTNCKIVGNQDTLYASV